MPLPAAWLSAGCLLISAGQAGAANMLVTPLGTNVLLQVRGDSDNDWFVETSTDLVSWSTVSGLGPLLADDIDPPSVRAAASDDGPHFFRARRTDGLFDTNLLRRISLTFTQTNWQSLLTTARSTGSNVLCSLALDNGATNPGVGARYKGNSSFTGMGGSVPVKKSLNLDLDFTNRIADLMGYETINVNNAYGDETIFREPLYFTVMRRYAICPRACMVQLTINGAEWGVYSLAQQQDGDFAKEWFPSSTGDRWRAPNMGGGGGGGGGFGGNNSALSWLGTNQASYTANYELKYGAASNAWPRLIHACDVLNNTPASDLRAQLETVLAVDRWLWFLALENLFADEDSYYYKGADYMFYYEPESGRIHPMEHDGNESLTPTDVSLSPVTGTARPVLSKLLGVPELRQRYLAHLRTVLEESFNPAAIAPIIAHFSGLSVNAIAADPKKSFTMAAYTNDLTAMRNFIQQRHKFLTNHAELRPMPPQILALHLPTNPPTALEIPTLTAVVEAVDTNGLDSVWLYHRGKPYGVFTAVQMQDDGAHGDGAAGDGVFGAKTAAYPAGTKVRCYVEARSANPAKAARFLPARAEEDTLNYRVAITTAPSSPVVLNEILASNTTTLADPQGEFDDWIELRNVTDFEVDLTGRYLSDEPNNPRKWPFPDGTRIPANGYLIVWADEDTTDTPGLHASFKLSASGEHLFLTDTDAQSNAILDSVAFGDQVSDRSTGRTATDADVWAEMTPTPGEPNL